MRHKTEEFSTFDIQKALGLQRGRLRAWMDLGFITPSKKAEGRADRTKFTREDAYAVGLFRCLVDAGFLRDVAARFVQGFIAREKDEPKKQQTEFIIFRIVGKEVSVFPLAAGDLTWDITSGSVMVERVPMAKIRKEDGSPFFKDFIGEWDKVHIFHFGRLKKRVDESLSKLR